MSKAEFSYLQSLKKKKRKKRKLAKIMPEKKIDLKDSSFNLCDLLS